MNIVERRQSKGETGLEVPEQTPQRDVLGQKWRTPGLNRLALLEQIQGEASRVRKWAARKNKRARRKAPTGDTHEDEGNRMRICLRGNLVDSASYCSFTKVSAWWRSTR